jgi:hypothetical protein
MEEYRTCPSTPKFSRTIYTRKNDHLFRRCLTVLFFTISPFHMLNTWSTTVVVFNTIFFSTSCFLHQLIVCEKLVDTSNYKTRCLCTSLYLFTILSFILIYKTATCLIELIERQKFAYLRRNDVLDIEFCFFFFIRNQS